MKFFNFFKKKTPSFIFEPERCQWAQQHGQELNLVMHSQIAEYLGKYYKEELKTTHFQERKSVSNEVFEVACIGLSIILLYDKVEKENLDTDILKNCLKKYQDIYSTLQKSKNYQHIMKFMQDYQNFAESEIALQIKSSDEIYNCFTGAWVIRYYIGQEATIQFDTAIELGKIINETIGGIWQKKTT